jgi:23S rRNA pseudouridine1911/1915/1917 synthase
MMAKSSQKTGFPALKAVISPDVAGQRLDKALALVLAGKKPALSRARVQALIQEGLVTRDGKPVAAGNRKVKEDEIYVVRLPEPQPAKPVAQNIPLAILYEDRDLLVIDKPAGMVAHPAPGNREGTLVNALLAHCGASLSGIGGVARPGIVHRLDKDTSGLMVVAKNDAAHQALSEQFSDRSLSRTYHALVWGEPVPRVGTIEAPIGRHARDRKKMAVTAKGKLALTKYRVLEVFKTTSLVECTLMTGRTHQIRVHLAHRKHPVVGDPVYGKKRPPTKDKRTALLYEFPRQALHAVELQFKHPRTGKAMRFASEVPKDMAKLLRQVRP